MRTTCKLFSTGNKPPDLLIALEGVSVTKDVRAIAKNFAALLRIRHEADYDDQAVFTKFDAQAATDLAADTLTLIRGLSPQRSLIDYASLVSLLLHR